MVIDGEKVKNRTLLKPGGCGTPEHAVELSVCA
jgi:hypothetical protein